MKIIFLFLFSFYIFCNVNGIELIKNDRSNACIIIKKTAAPPIHFAASEISGYAKKITDSNIPIIGKSDKKNKYEISFEMKSDPALGEEGFSIKGNDRSLIISGNTSRAILYGTYAFIEEFFGVRWFAPGELYEHVPVKKTLIIPDKIERTGKPEFSIRQIGFVSSNVNSFLEKSWLFLIRNRWQIKGHYRLLDKFEKYYQDFDAQFSGGGHCLASLIPDKLFDTHPEYFALVNGKRIRQFNARGQAISQPCTTHPEVILMAVKGIAEYFHNAPPGSSYLIGNNDVQVWCECSNCTALDTHEDRQKGRVSNRFFTFINTVTKKVREIHPDAKILAWGYQNFRYAPTKVIPDKNLRINLCDHQRCYKHSLADKNCKQNDQFRDMFSSWRQYGLPVTERGYQENLLKNGYFYLPIEYVIADDLRYFKSIGVDGYRYITTPPDGTYRKKIPAEKAEFLKNAMYCLWPGIYICGKMFWDTSLDPEKIWEDAGKLFYGKAWTVMKEYRKLLLQTYTESTGHIIYNTSPIEIGRALQVPGTEKQLLALLEKATELAATDDDKKVALRLASEKKFFMETWIKNARVFEQTQYKTSSAGITSEKIIIDGKTDEKSWKKVAYTVGCPKNSPNLTTQPDIYTKVLFDKNFIYLAIAGTQPSVNEKWILTFNGSNNKKYKFDLNKKTPFKKAVKTDHNKVCYELCIPFTMAGLTQKSAGFIFNIQRIKSAQISARLYQKTLGCVTLGEEAVKNGSFSDIQKTSAKRKNILSDKFPKYWGFSGKNSLFKKGKLHLNGVIYQYMAVSGGKNGGILQIDIAASTSDSKTASHIQPYLSLCSRAPGDRRKFQHALKKYEKKTSVKSPQIYNYTFELSPWENGYLYIRGENAVLENISAAFSSKEP